MNEVKNGKYLDRFGNTEWYENGIHHREDGPAIEWLNGTTSWYLNGLRHREYGPAIEYTNGAYSWWLNGKEHCDSRPAQEYSNGNKQWFLNDQELTEEEFNQWIVKKSLNEKLHITLERKLKIKGVKI